MYVIVINGQEIMNYIAIQCVYVLYANSTCIVYYSIEFAFTMVIHGNDRKNTRSSYWDSKMHYPLVF